jgi:hypothetical protein
MITTVSVSPSHLNHVGRVPVLAVHLDDLAPADRFVEMSGPDDQPIAYNSPHLRHPLRDIAIVHRLAVTTTPASSQLAPPAVPLSGSQCGVGNGRTIAWTAHDDRFRLAIGH